MSQFIRQTYSFINKNVKYVKNLPFIRPHTTNQINTYVKPKNSLLQLNTNINNPPYKNIYPYIPLSKISKNLETINSSNQSNQSNQSNPSKPSNCIKSNNESKLSNRTVISCLIIGIISGGIGGIGVTMCIVYSYNVYDDIAVLFMY